MFRFTLNESLELQQDFNSNHIVFSELILVILGILLNFIFLIIIHKNIDTKSFSSRKPMGFLLIGLYYLLN